MIGAGALAFAVAWVASADGGFVDDAGAGPVASRADAHDAVWVPDGGGGPGASLVIEEFESPGPGSFGPSLVVEPFEVAGPWGQKAPDAAQGPPATLMPEVVLGGQVRGQAAVDTHFESAASSPPERVFDLQARGRLWADVKLGERTRVWLEGRAFWRAGAGSGLSRAKATFEAELGEAYVDWYGKGVDLRLGNQVVAFGANPAFAPADVLNPRDLRGGILGGEPEDAKVAALGVRARGEVGKVSWTAVYFPFFAPHRYAVFGQDEALLQPSLGQAVPITLHESVEDGLQPHLFETERPKAFPWLGDVGLRATTPVEGVTLGLSWVWMNEKLPRVWVDPELGALMTAQARGEPVNPALALSVQNRFAANETLYRGTYGRQHVLSAEASLLVRSTQLDVDVAYLPQQPFFDEHLGLLTKDALAWVLGASQAEDSPLVYSVSYVGLAVPELRANELLLLLEPATARGASRVGWLHLLMGMVSYRAFGDRLELSLTAAFEVVQRSFAVRPAVTYLGFDRLTLLCAVEVFEGSPYSPLGYFGRNDQVLVGIKFDLW